MTTRNSIFRRRAVILSAVLFICAVSGYFALGWGVYYWKEYTHHYEPGAVSDLFALHTMQENYKKDHGSYAGTFSQLGVPLGARLNSDTLTWSGRYGYRIIEVIQNQHGTVLDYSIDARPATYSHGSKRSYLMDQNGTVYFTSANRGATKGDPSIRSER
ncbi:MAG: hypothetical protein ABSF93_00205 [Candidatus Sulfotelmatobacter sp.]